MNDKKISEEEMLMLEELAKKDDMYEGPAPMMSAGLPPTAVLDHLRYYGENKSLTQDKQTGEVKGDVPAEMKFQFFALQNKNPVNANLTEKEVRQSELRAVRLKMFARAFTPENEQTADRLLMEEQTELDFHHRITQGRGGFGTKQRTTMTSISMQGQVNPEQQTGQKQPTFL